MTRKIAFIGFILILAAVIIIPRLTSETDIREAEPVVKNKRQALQVNVKIAKPSQFSNSIQTAGSVLSSEEVELHPEVSGKIIKLNINEGEKVKRGDLLLKINDSELQAQLKKAEIKRKFAAEKEARQKIMFEKNLLSKEAYDIILNDLNTAEADVENIKALIDKTEIKAPFDGVIGLRYISPGSYVTPASKIASLQNISKVKIDFSIPQKFAHLINRGKTIKITSGTDSRVYEGKVFAVEPKIDPSTRTLQVRAICDNSHNYFISGSYTTVSIDLDNVTNSITIPTQALVNDITGEKVFIYNKGKAVPRKITSGIRNETDVQVIDGIKTGDTIIVSGIMNLRPKVKVRIKSIVQ